MVERGIPDRVLVARALKSTPPVLPLLKVDASELGAFAPVGRSDEKAVGREKYCSGPPCPLRNSKASGIPSSGG